MDGYIQITYPAKLITLKVLGLPTAEASFIDKIGQFLFHKFFNLSNSQFQAFFTGARNVQIERRVLYRLQLTSTVELFQDRERHTAAVAMLLSG